MQAMIFSAGLGTRFRPWTDHHPKALAIVNGKSLLQRNIEYLQRFGIREVVVNLHHFADEIEDTVKQNDGWGSSVIFSNERNDVLETGGGLLHARNLLGNERFVTCNVDILTDLDLNKLLEFHELHRPLISFAVTKRNTSRYFLFDESNQLCGWRNSKTKEERVVLQRPALVEKAYSCVVVFEPEIFSLVPFAGKFSLVEVYLHLARNHAIMGYDHTGDKFVDVGKPESVAIAEAVFA